MPDSTTLPAKAGPAPRSAAPEASPRASPPARPDRQTHVAWLESQVERLETLLRPADPDTVDTALDLLLEGFRNAGEVSEMKVSAYVVALEGVSQAALSGAVHDVLQGRVPELNPKFPPQPPELARLCRARTEAMWDELRGRREELRRETEPPPVLALPDGPTQARIAAGLAELSRNLARLAAESEMAEAERRYRLAGTSEGTRRVIAEVAQRRSGRDLVETEPGGAA